jgi:hypothetical protein
MHKILIPLIIFILANFCHAQMYDNIWCMGYESIGDSNFVGGQNIDFRYDPPQVFYRNREADFDVTSGSICDSLGNLLFYTNGCKIYNADDEVIEGGDSLTRMDNYWTQDFWCPFGFTARQGVLVLPDSYKSSEYYVFHQDVNIYPNLYPKLDELYMTKVNMHVNNGHGKVVSKRNLILNKLTTLGSLSAVQHANGRDWWIVIASLNEPIFNIFLVDENGLKLKSEQEIGESLNYTQISMSAKFSPDGKTYARFHLLEGVEMFDFDRRTGTFSNPRHLPFWEELVQGDQLGDGLEFSPDSKKLYVCYNTALFQFDLSADDVFGSLQLIDTLHIDTTEFFRPSFYQMQLAPNSKIYMSCLNGTMVLHVIDEPNNLGRSCNFVQRGFRLRTYNAFTMPYFPNFRLGRDTTVSVTEHNPSEKLYIYPNPSNTYIYLSGLDKYEGNLIQIYNGNGALVKQETLTSNKIEVSTLPIGMYYLRLGNALEKFVKME